MAKVVYIAGYGRSGSTLLDVMLSSCDGYVGIGEASNIFSAISADETCSCGKKISECDFWRAYVDRIDAGSLNRRQRWSEGLLGWLAFSVFPSYRSFWIKFLQSMAAEGMVVVDSSKVSRATLFRAANFARMGASVTVVHLFKKPDLLLVSLMKGSNKDLEAGRKSLAINHLFLIRSFMGAFMANFFTVLVGRFFADRYIKVDYEDIVKSPSSVLEGIGVPSHSELSFIDMDAGHAISGNRMRKSVRKISLNRPDGSGLDTPSLPSFYVWLYNLLNVFI